MKRFMLFTGDDYYPAGGIRDFKGSFDTWQGAVMTARKLLDRDASNHDDWAHIYDSVLETEIWDNMHGMKK